LPRCLRDFWINIPDDLSNFQKWQDDLRNEANLALPRIAKRIGYQDDTALMDAIANSGVPLYYKDRSKFDTKDFLFWLNLFWETMYVNVLFHVPEPFDRFIQAQLQDAKAAR
jgi:hypothetical protein